MPAQNCRHRRSSATNNHSVFFDTSPVQFVAIYAISIPNTDLTQPLHLRRNAVFLSHVQTTSF